MIGYLANQYSSKINANLTFLVHDQFMSYITLMNKKLHYRDVLPFLCNVDLCVVVRYS